MYQTLRRGLRVSSSFNVFILKSFFNDDDFIFHVLFFQILQANSRSF